MDNDSTIVFIFGTRMQSDLDCASSARSIAKSVSCSFAPFVFSSFVSWFCSLCKRCANRRIQLENTRQIVGFESCQQSISATVVNDY